MNAGGADRLRQLPAQGPPPPQTDPAAIEAAAAQPIRHITRQVAFEPDGWTPERAAKIAALFDGMAADWQQRIGPERVDAVADALARGSVVGASCLELGSGTGFATGLLAGHFATVLAVDLSLEMLRRAPAGIGTRLWADASRLPVRDGSVDVAVAVNMFLFRAELERVLRPDGTLVWVSSLGPLTPIHLSAGEVLDALGEDWHGVASQWGGATWCVARRGRAG